MMSIGQVCLETIIGNSGVRAPLLAGRQLKEDMRNIGMTLVLAGIVLVAFALNYDTTVSAGLLGHKIHNLGLMEERRTDILIGCITALAGVALWVGSTLRSGRPGATTSAEHSVADEIAKLSKLHADNVLTDAEFQEQKRRLLA